MPIVLLIPLSALLGIDPDLKRAALSLGANRIRVFCRAVLPMALPGVLSATLFAFLTSFDELLISLFLAGVRAQSCRCGSGTPQPAGRADDRGGDCSGDAHSRPRSHPATPTRTTPLARLRINLSPARSKDGARTIGSQPVPVDRTRKLSGWMSSASRATSTPPDDRRSILINPRILLLRLLDRSARR
jgi:hypothetical protein